MEYMNQKKDITQTARALNTSVSRVIDGIWKSSIGKKTIKKCDSCKESIYDFLQSHKEFPCIPPVFFKSPKMRLNLRNKFEIVFCSYTHQWICNSCCDIYCKDKSICLVRDNR